MCIRDRSSAGLLGVQAGPDYWLLDLADSGEILPLPPFTSVPLTRPWFCGIANIRGSLYGVARNWFGLERISEIMYDDRPLFEEIVETLADVVITVLDYVLGAGVRPEAASMWEDMAYSGGPVMANYIPVLEDPLFIWGLVIFGAGSVMLVGRSLIAAPAWAMPRNGADALRSGLSLGLIPAVVALLAVARSWPLPPSPLHAPPPSQNPPPRPSRGRGRGPTWGAWGGAVTSRDVWRGRGCPGCGRRCGPGRGGRSPPSCARPCSPGGWPRRRSAAPTPTGP